MSIAIRAASEQWVGVGVVEEGNTSLIRGLVGDLRCKNNPVKAECSNKTMFIDSHTQNSKMRGFFAQMQGFICYVKASLLDL